MVKKLLAAAVLCLLLCGCTSWLEGSYHSVSPHQRPETEQLPQSMEIENYSQLVETLQSAVELGSTNFVLSASYYRDIKNLDRDLDAAIEDVIRNDPLAAYAVEQMQYERNTLTGRTLISFSVSYRANREDVHSIPRVQTMQQGLELVYGDLVSVETGTVFLAEDFQNLDFAQIIQDYADSRPELVMEVPQVTVRLYPESGERRLVALQYTYQTSRESLRAMQSYVRNIFTAAGMYVSGDSEKLTKYQQLYAFVVERFDYTYSTSITPAYSLLRYGVGDSRTFAVVYAAMCRQAGLECSVVSGTKNAEAWYWNIIHDGTAYYHADLYASGMMGGLELYGDENMEGYVWDYSAYPACGILPEPEPTQAETEATEPGKN